MATADKSDEEKSYAAKRQALWDKHQQHSRQTIYQTIMRNGGEPFGTPFEKGLPTLTERVVRYFKQRGFFAFESVEKHSSKIPRNKFTRHGATNYRGTYTASQEPHVPRRQHFLIRLLQKLGIVS